MFGIINCRLHRGSNDNSHASSNTGLNHCCGQKQHRYLNGGDPQVPPHQDAAVNQLGNARILHLLISSLVTNMFNVDFNFFIFQSDLSIFTKNANYTKLWPAASASTGL